MTETIGQAKGRLDTVHAASDRVACNDERVVEQVAVKSATWFSASMTRTWTLR